MAAFAGRLNVVQALRQHGARYQLQDKNGLTALHWACDSKNAELVDWMLNDGADVDVRDCNGHTPLLRVGWCFYELLSMLRHFNFFLYACSSRDKSKSSVKRTFANFVHHVYGTVF